MSALCAVAAALWSLVATVSARHRAAAAADLVALAGARHALAGEAAVCGAAGAVAAAHAAALRACSLDPDALTVTVTVAVPLPGPLARFGDAHGRACAGPVVIDDQTEPFPGAAAALLGAPSGGAQPLP